MECFTLLSMQLVVPDGRIGVFIYPVFVIYISIKYFNALGKGGKLASFRYCATDDLTLGDE